MQKIYANATTLMRKGFAVLKCALLLSRHRVLEVEWYAPSVSAPSSCTKSVLCAQLL